MRGHHCAGLHCAQFKKQSLLSREQSEAGRSQKPSQSEADREAKKIERKKWSPVHRYQSGCRAPFIVSKKRSGRTSFVVAGPQLIVSHHHHASYHTPHETWSVLMTCGTCIILLRDVST